MKLNYLYVAIFLFISFLALGQQAQHQKNIKEVLLIGDTGYSPAYGKSKGLQALEKYIEQNPTNDAHLVFLGDNIYPKGMPVTSDKMRSDAETRINHQIDIAKKFDGLVTFIPGNHDYYADGIPAVKRQEAYIDDHFDQKDDWLPEPGCAIDGKEIGEHVYLVTVDSQWFLSDWDKHPQINKGCHELQTREEFFTELGTEIKKNQNKTIIVALHHPLYSSGHHGGKFALNDHIFPVNNWLPMPGLGSLAVLLRSNGASVQDINNGKYQYMVDRMKTIAKKWDRVIFTSGHEHNLQYIEEDGIKQVVSGAGSKNSHVRLARNGKFATDQQGFARLRINKNGASTVDYFGLENGELTRLATQKVYNSLKQIDISDLPDQFNNTIKASIYQADQNPDPSKLGKSILGDHYRQLYYQSIEAKVVALDTLYGGLQPVQLGGGNQTNSLRFVDDQNREYNLREIKKNSTRLLQINLYKDKYLRDEFKDTAIEDLVEDILTASHPFAFLTVPTLADAINVPHTNPDFFYVPKQKTLGKFNEEHGNSLYMIEERPEEHWLGLKSFGSPNHSIESSEDFYDHIRRDEKYRLDEVAYIRARVFDILIGDFDRHLDQWRWAETEKEDGTHVFQPIPRDRDQVFSNFDGGLFDALRALSSFPKIYQSYGDDIDHIKWYSFNAHSLDRSLLRNKGKQEWLKQVDYIQNHIDKEVIEKAFAKMPAEVKGKANEELKKTLLKRKANLKNLISSYYDNISRYVMLQATDKDDFIDVYRLDNGNTKVEIWRNKGGKREDRISHRVFSDDITKEVWIYGLDDTDIFTVKGNGKSGTMIRLIGGYDKDEYQIDNKKRLKIYDFEAKDEVKSKGKSKGKSNLHLTNAYDKTRFLRNKKVYTAKTSTPRVGFNPDDGFLIGANFNWTKYGFIQNPYEQKHSISAGYYFAEQGYDLSYEGKFSGFFKGFQLATNLRFTSPNYVRNFFGIGNETNNPDDELDRDFNRIQLESIIASLGLEKSSGYGAKYSFGFRFENRELKRTDNRILDVNGDQFLAQDDKFFDHKQFLSIYADYSFYNVDDELRPARGVDFKLNTGVTANLNDTEKTFAYFNPSLAFFHPLNAQKTLALKTTAQSQINVGNSANYEFYQAPQIGANSGLRGFRRQRFTGDQSLVGSVDLRYAFPQFKTSVAPMQIGVLTGYDIGRVWVDDQSSDIWHDDYGIGAWLNVADLASGTFNLFHSDEGFWFTFGLSTGF
jgi:hypothetical protein